MFCKGTKVYKIFEINNGHCTYVAESLASESQDKMKQRDTEKSLQFRAVLAY
jgi:hypothetical protein